MGACFIQMMCINYIKDRQKKVLCCSNFLNQVKNFDAVVPGTFYRQTSGNEKAFFVIEKVYKGNIRKDTVRLADGGLGCYMWLNFESGTRLY